MFVGKYVLYIMYACMYVCMYVWVSEVLQYIHKYLEFIICTLQSYLGQGRSFLSEGATSRCSIGIVQLLLAGGAVSMYSMCGDNNYFIPSVDRKRISKTICPFGR